MDRTDSLIKAVAECILDEEGSFHAIVNADMLDIPLEGTQRLILGGKATPYLKFDDGGIAVGLSINRFHYDVFIPWDVIFAVEGEKKAFYCRRGDVEKEEKPENTGAREKRHLRLLKD